MYYIISACTFSSDFRILVVTQSIRNFTSCINIDRVAPKTSKTEALCPIDRQSMFVNLKVDGESRGAFIFPACFPSGQQSYFYFLLGELQDVMLCITISKWCRTLSYFIIYICRCIFFFLLIPFFISYNKKIFAQMKLQER